MNQDLSSKKLVRGIFESANPSRLPFIPWIFTHAARMEQVTVKTMFNDVSRYTRCLQNARKLYGYDAIAGSFDPSLEAEICGCPITWKSDYETPAASPFPLVDLELIKNLSPERISQSGRFGTVIESLRRINLVAGKTVAMIAVVTGPLTLMANLKGGNLIQDLADKPEEAHQAVEVICGLLLKIIQDYCQLELDVIVVADRLMPLLPTSRLPWLKSALSPLLNTIRFYNAFSVLLPGEISSPENLPGLIDLGFDGIVAAGIGLDDWNRIKGGQNCVLGKAIPSRLLVSGQKELQDYLDNGFMKKIEPGVFLTTEWEVPADTPPENMHLIRKWTTSICP